MESTRAYMSSSVFQHRKPYAGEPRRDIAKKSRSLPAVLRNERPQPPAAGSAAIEVESVADLFERQDVKKNQSNRDRAKSLRDRIESSSRRISSMKHESADR